MVNYFQLGVTIVVGKENFRYSNFAKLSEGFKKDTDDLVDIPELQGR